MAVKKTAAERVADLRAEAEAAGEDVSRLSDLELLNGYLELRERECIDTRDRYMGLLVAQRKHGDTVREATRQAISVRIDALAVNAVHDRAEELNRILVAVEALPERITADRVQYLKQIAADTRHLLHLRGDDPTTVWRVDNNAALVREARTVLGVLGSRDGIPADEVLRLVGEALKPDGNLHDLFTVADTGTLKPHLRHQHPQFFGGDWTERGDYYAYEPDGSGARVVAYAVGDDWYLDLYSPTGSLLAYGIAPEGEVAGIATALVERAPAWAADRSRRPWQRYTELTTAAVEKQLAPAS